jgi:hypothetical protein
MTFRTDADHVLLHQAGGLLPGHLRRHQVPKLLVGEKTFPDLYKILDATHHYARLTWMFLLLIMSEPGIFSLHDRA